MESLRNRQVAEGNRRHRTALLAATCLMVVLSIAGNIRGADPVAPNPLPTFQKYCFQCHGKAAMGGMNLEQLTSQGSPGENFQQWDKVIAVLEQSKMPPKGMPQPTPDERAKALSWIRTELAGFIKKHEGDPGRVTLRRLTSGEYAYTIQDLTGLANIDVGIDASSDSVGGEGFTNFGDVQFMQDANLERYLEAAKRIADHAVIGAGPLEFYPDPGKTGFELSAIARIREIYAKYGFRTVSGEGGRPFGLEKYGKALYAAWRFRHRAALGEPNVTLKELAAREGITARFAEHISSVMNRPSLGYPSSEIADRWRKLPAPAGDVKASAAGARTACEEIQQYLTTWPSWLFGRGDLAAGGAGDESPLMFNDNSLRVNDTHRFVFLRGGRGAGARGPAPPPGPARIYFNVAALNPTAKGKPVIIWRNPTVGIRPLGQFPGRGGVPGQPVPTAKPQTPATPPAEGQAAAAQTGAAQGAGAGFRRGQAPPGPRQTVRSVVSAETAQRLKFGSSPDGTPIGPDDFASEGSAWFEVPMPEGAFSLDIQVDAVLGADRDQVFRIMISDREDGRVRGIPTRTLLGDMKSAGYQTFKSGVLEFASLLPPNSHGEPTPADKDPIPLPFDSTYNVPEHDGFNNDVKYVRDDRFVVENMLDEAMRTRLNNAWHDLYASFGYHDSYLRMLAQHFSLDLKGKGIAQMDRAAIEALPAEMRQYVPPLRADYEASQAAQVAGRRRHLDDALKFASRAWRRPLTEKEKLSLRAFYDKTISIDSDHRRAIRALLARILVAPQFLYRVELAADSSPVRPAASGLPLKALNNWEMASRLSYLLWSSVPDDELLRAAGSGELNTSQGIQRQAKRMLADPKARRLATEFFGQWLGFYHFDDFKGVDTSRYPEFTNEVRDAMYDEAVSFFEHVIRNDRPVREILFADYTFLNQPLAKFYGVKKEIKSSGPVELVEGAGVFQRGGLLRLGAILTATSAPLRTSPVKRGDWILRRVLGTPVPPPPADAGSIPADDKLFGGLTVKARLEAHKRNATCANCHMRIDPLGFSLEHYDSTGRWRDQYNDGKPIEDTAALADQTEIAGVKGLFDYLQSKDLQVRRTLSFKLLGYALGRTVIASDQPLVERMVGAGPSAGFSQLVAEIVASKQFRNRQARDAAPDPPSTKVARVTAPRRGQADRAGRPASRVPSINSGFAKVGGR